MLPYSQEFAKTDLAKYLKIGKTSSGRIKSPSVFDQLAALSQWLHEQEEEAENTCDTIVSSQSIQAKLDQADTVFNLDYQTNSSILKLGQCESDLKIGGQSDDNVASSYPNSSNPNTSNSNSSEKTTSSSENKLTQKTPSSLSPSISVALSLNVQILLHKKLANDSELIQKCLQGLSKTLETMSLGALNQECGLNAEIACQLDEITVLVKNWYTQFECHKRRSLYTLAQLTRTRSSLKSWLSLLKFMLNSADTKDADDENSEMNSPESKRLKIEPGSSDFTDSYTLPQMLRQETNKLQSALETSKYGDFQQTSVFPGYLPNFDDNAEIFKLSRFEMRPLSIVPSPDGRFLFVSFYRSFPPQNEKMVRPAWICKYGTGLKGTDKGRVYVERAVKPGSGWVMFYKNKLFFREKCRNNYAANKLENQSEALSSLQELDTETLELTGNSLKLINTEENLDDDVVSSKYTIADFQQIDESFREIAIQSMVQTPDVLMNVYKELEPNMLVKISSVKLIDKIQTSRNQSVTSTTNQHTQPTTPPVAGPPPFLGPVLPNDMPQELRDAVQSMFGNNIFNNPTQNSNGNAAPPVPPRIARNSSNNLTNDQLTNPLFTQSLKTSAGIVQSRIEKCPIIHTNKEVIIIAPYNRLNPVNEKTENANPFPWTNVEASQSYHCIRFSAATGCLIKSEKKQLSIKFGRTQGMVFKRPNQIVGTRGCYDEKSNSLWTVSAGVGTMTPGCCDGIDTFFTKFDIDLFDDESYENGKKQQNHKNLKNSKTSENSKNTVNTDPDCCFEELNNLIEVLLNKNGKDNSLVHLATNLSDSEIEQRLGICNDILETYILKSAADQIHSSKFIHTSLIVFNVMNVSIGWFCKNITKMTF